MMYRLLSLLLLYFLPLYPGKIEEIKKRGELVVAMISGERPPFFQREEGGEGIEGFDVELARALARQLGVKLLFNRSSDTFTGTVELVSSGQADIAISKLSDTLSRAEVVSFSNPYLKLKQTLVIHRVKRAELRRGYNVLSALNYSEVTVGALENSSYVAYAQLLLPEAKVKTYPSNEALFQAVESGDIYAVLVDNVIALNWLKAHPLASLKIQTKVLEERNDPLAIALPKEEFHLWNWINLYLRWYPQQKLFEEKYWTLPLPEGETHDFKFIQQKEPL